MRILFVDAGNYCRSPAAEVVARHHASRAGVRSEFGSAGLKDKHVGQGADPRTVAACAARGYSLGAFRCRQIAVDDWHSWDRILAMDRDNLAHLQRIRPAGATATVALFLGDREVPDPYFGDSGGFDLMMARIEVGVALLLREASK
jgi:protein-tyrosine phosphatase